MHWNVLFFSLLYSHLILRICHEIILTFSVNTSKKFSSRTNAGDVVASLGVTDKTKWQGHGQACSIQLYDEEAKLTSSFKYMFQKLAEKAHGNFFCRCVE